MASAFSHSILAFSLARGVCPQYGKRFQITAVACSILPDVDVIGFAFGVSYGAFLGHRGFTHSLVFALLVALFAVRMMFPDAGKLSREWWKGLIFFFVVTASHGILDAMTDGGLGIAFFSPFDLSRYFLPWRPLAVSPIGIFDFFTEGSWEILRTECVWVIAPSLLFLAGATVFRRYQAALKNA